MLWLLHNELINVYISFHEDEKIFQYLFKQFIGGLYTHHIVRNYRTRDWKLAVELIDIDIQNVTFKPFTLTRKNDVELFKELEADTHSISIKLSTYYLSMIERVHILLLFCHLQINCHSFIRFQLNWIEWNWFWLFESFLLSFFRTGSPNAIFRTLFDLQWTFIRMNLTLVDNL